MSVNTGNQVDDNESAFSKQIGKWQNYTRGGEGGWRYEARPQYRDLAISVVRGGEKIEKTLEHDMRVLADAEKSIDAMNLFVENGGIHDVHVAMPLPVNTYECLIVKRATQMKVSHSKNCKGNASDLSVVRSSSSTNNVPTSINFLGEGAFLTSAPYHDDSHDVDTNVTDDVVDRGENKGNSASSNMLEVAKRHNSVRLRKQSLKQQQNAAPSEPPVIRPIVSSPFSRSLLVPPDSPSCESSQLVTSPVRISSDKRDITVIDDSLSGLLESDGRASNVDTAYQRTVRFAAQSSSHPYNVSPSHCRSAEVVSGNIEVFQMKTHNSGICYQEHFFEWPEEPESHDPYQLQSSCHDLFHAEQLLREAEMRAAALEHEEDEFIEQVRRHNRLKEEVEQDIQNYERSIPDVTKTQQSWLRAKKEHAITALKQARKESARELRAEFERCKVDQAKREARMEALTQLMEQREMKRKKMHKVKRLRPVDNTQQGGSGDNGTSVEGQESLPQSRSKSSQATGLSTEKQLDGKVTGHYSPSWQQRQQSRRTTDKHPPRGVTPPPAAADDGRVEYRGAKSNSAPSITVAVTVCTAAPREVGCGEKWLAAVLAERKMSKPMVAQEPDKTVTGMEKKEIGAAPPMSRRQAIEAAKENEKAKEHGSMVANNRGSKSKNSKRKKRRSMADEASLLGEDELDLLVCETENEMRRNFQSVLSLLSPAVHDRPDAGPSGRRVPTPTQCGTVAAAPSTTYSSYALSGGMDSTAKRGGRESVCIPPLPRNIQLLTFTPPSSLAVAAVFEEPTNQPSVSLTAPGALQSLVPSSPSFSSSSIGVGGRAGIRGGDTTLINSLPAGGTEQNTFFDPASSTYDKGRHRLQDPRDFEADSIRCIPDEINRAVTLVMGRKRRRLLPLHDTSLTSASVALTGIESGKGEAPLEVVAVLFDRHVFTTENEARLWWLQNLRRLSSSN